MTTIAHITNVLHTVFSAEADRVARETGFIQRPSISKFSGRTFLETLVFGWFADPHASLGTLAGTASQVGVTIHPQALDQRFTPQAAEFLRRMLAYAVTFSVKGETVPLALLERFSEVLILDSSTITLPDALADVWPGCGGRVVQGSASALKFGLAIDLKTGALRGPFLENARTHDGATAIQAEPVAAGGLRIADVGFFALERLAQLADDGGYWITRVRAGTKILDAQGKAWQLSHWLQTGGSHVDAAVRLGKQQQLPVRLLAVRVPKGIADERRRRMRREAKREGKTVSAERLALADWTIYATNAPANLLNIDEAMVLYRARWQIELVFKAWKSQGGLTHWRTNKRWRILCEVYSKLIALLVQHWILVTSCWHYPDRSLPKADALIRMAAQTICLLLRGPLTLERWLEFQQQALERGARMNKRRKRPNTYQLLADPSLCYAEAF